MFWTDWGDSRAGIYRSDMDGSLAGCIVSEGVRWPNGISVDDHWIYWTEAYMDRIERVDFNGMQRSVILDSLPHPYAIAVFKVCFPCCWFFCSMQALEEHGAHWVCRIGM